MRIIVIIDITYIGVPPLALRVFAQCSSRWLCIKTDDLYF